MDHDTKLPLVKIPKHTILTDLDPVIVRYFKSIPDATRLLETILRKLHGKVKWSHDSYSELNIQCIISKTDVTARSQAKDWQRRVKEAVNYLVSSILIRKRECIKKSWKEVVRQVGKLDKLPQVAIMERDEETAFYIVGSAKFVNKVHHQVDKICTETEQSLESIEDTVKLTAQEILILQKVNFTKASKMSYPKLNVILGRDGIKFIGPPKELLEAEKEVNGLIRSLKTRVLNLSKGQLKVLKMLQRQPDNAVDTAIQFLKAVIYMENDAVTLIGLGKDLDKCEEALRRNLKEANVEVTQEEQMALTGNLWAEFANNLFMWRNGVLHLELLKDTSSVNIVATAEDFEGVLEDVKTHIQKHTVRETFIEMDIPHTRMIEYWMKDDLRKIEADFKAYSVTIDADMGLNGGLPGFSINGTEDGLAPAKRRIEKLTEKIMIDSHTVTTTGMPYYFTQQESGRYFIKAQENKYHVIVRQENPNDQKRREQMKSTLQTNSQGTRELNHASHKSGVKVRVLVGDMTSHRVDAIVNAANSDLKHAGGLARAIVNKGEVKCHSCVHK